MGRSILSASHANEEQCKARKPIEIIYSVPTFVDTCCLHDPRLGTWVMKMQETTSLPPESC